MPITKAGLMAGKVLFGLAVGLAQIIILFLVASVLFGVSLGHDIVAFALVTVGLSATVTTLGLAAAAIKFPGSAITAPLVIGALLGGCLFSQDLLPPLLRVVSYLIPHSWAMQGYQDLMLRGYGLAETLPEIGALFLFALIFFAFAAWRFDPLD
jgi:ABC-2 type transport system permease protein